MSNKPSAFAVVIVAMFFSSCGIPGADKRSDPESAAREFTAAVDHQDIDRLRAIMSPEITMFYPFLALRSNDRDAVIDVFEGPFARRRASAPGPRYLNLEPTDFKTQWLGRDAAVVTYHLDRGELMGRRTAVVRWNGDQWEIVSFHASQVPKP